MDIPPQILKKLKKSENEANAVLEEAVLEVTDFDTSVIRLRVTSTASLPLMTWEEQAQSLAFVVRYEHLPELMSIELFFTMRMMGYFTVQLRICTRELSTQNILMHRC